MKKIVLSIFFLGLSVSVFAQTADQRSGVIRELSGTVELRNAGSANYTPARVGDTVAENTVISTGIGSIVLLEVGSSLISVKPLTRLTLTEIRASQGAENLNLNLHAGRVHVDVNPPVGTRASLSVASPVAVASVRGTSFDFDTRNINVAGGTVYFKGNRGYTYQVSGGFSVMVGGRGTVTPAQDTGSQPVILSGQDSTARTTGGSGGMPGGSGSEGVPGGPGPTGPGDGDIGIYY